MSHPYGFKSIPVRRSARIQRLSENLRSSTSNVENLNHSRSSLGHNVNSRNRRSLIPILMSNSDSNNIDVNTSERDNLNNQLEQISNNIFIVESERETREQEMSSETSDEEHEDWINNSIELVEESLESINLENTIQRTLNSSQISDNDENSSQTPIRHSSQIPIRHSLQDIDNNRISPLTVDDGNSVEHSSQTSGLLRTSILSSSVAASSSTDISNQSNDSNLISEGATASVVVTQISSEVNTSSTLDCAICLQKCVHPAKLPCSHIFCFLCLKGAAQQSHRCAMCRTPIPHDYLDRPELVETPEPTTLDNGYQWFYEGRNGGWWRYETRMSEEIEEKNIISPEEEFEILICGQMYVIDFQNMIQYSKIHPNRKRKIKRELINKIQHCKGIAGIGKRMGT